MRCWSLAMAAALGLALRGTSLAADPRFPDWPCNQIKVPEISVAAVWAGPPIDDVGNAWEEDAAIRDLVARLAARRTPLDDAQKAIADVVTGSEPERQKKAKLIFAGLFKTLNDERSDVMRGIERYARKQKEFSDQIRSTILQLREFQDRPDADPGKIDELTNRVEWDTRIFEERRKTMNFVCEVPFSSSNGCSRSPVRSSNRSSEGIAAGSSIYLGAESSVMARSSSSSSGIAYRPGTLG